MSAVIAAPMAIELKIQFRELVGARDEWLIRAPWHRERELPAHRHPTEPAGCLLAKSNPPGASKHKEEPKMTTENTWTDEWRLLGGDE
jgi:hypothetical protein